MNNNVKQLLGDTEGIFVFPNVYTEFNEKLHNPLTTNAQLADVIQFDAGLTAFLLKLVNSPFYGFSSTISSISHAISIIGRKQLATLVVGKSVMNALRVIDLPSSIITPYWEDNLRCALYAKAIAKKVNVTPHPPETFFVAGLIHAIGKLIIWHHHAELASIHKQHDALNDYLAHEQNTCGCTYNEVGAYLAAKWKLPNILIDTTANHNTLSEIRASQPCAAVYLATQLSRIAVDASASVTPNVIESLDETSQIVLKQMGMDEAVLVTVFEDVEKQFLELRSTFLH